MANVTVVGLAYARRNFKESSGPITAATTFASVACERPLIFIDAALGQMVKGTFRSAQGTREKNERGVWHPVRAQGLFIESLHPCSRRNFNPQFRFFGRETKEGISNEMGGVRSL